MESLQEQPPPMPVNEASSSLDADHTADAGSDEQPRMASFETQVATATMESEEARPHCFTCGTRTDYPMRAGGDCPHAACSLRCLEKLHSTWLDMRAELCEMDDNISKGRRY